MADRKITQLASLTSPEANDLFVVVDVSEGDNADKNKQLSFSTLHKTAPNGAVDAPAIGFSSDVNLTGFYRSDANEIAVSANRTYVAKFTPTGFQLGDGTAEAQLHLFSNDATDQVIIQNNNDTPDTAPDLVLYRNSSTPSSGDSLGNLEFRGVNDSSESYAYAQVLAQIDNTVADDEDGILQLITSSSGLIGSRITIKGNKVGVNEPSPEYALHINESTSNTGVCIESEEDTVALGANLVLYHHRGGNVSSQDNDLLSGVMFDGRNDATVPEQTTYASILANIVDASNGTESGNLSFQVITEGTGINVAQMTGSNVTLNVAPILPSSKPSSSTDPGTAGEVTWDQNYVYICVATNTWKRSPLSSF